MTEWRRIPIDLCRNYEASDDGQIRRVGKKLPLVGDVDRYGYRTVLLSYAGLKRRYKVHRLVCTAFHGPPPEGRECGHVDGAKPNNAASNLAWITHSENAIHNVRDGKNVGANHPGARLSDDEVAEIRRRFAAGQSGRSLARAFGIGSAHASKLIRGDSRPKDAP